MAEGDMVGVVGGDLLAAYSNVELFRDDTRVGRGHCIVTKQQLLWTPDGDGQVEEDPTKPTLGSPLTVLFDDIMMHAVCRDTTEFPEPCMCFQVETGVEEEVPEVHEGEEAEEEEKEEIVGLQNGQPREVTKAQMYRFVCAEEDLDGMFGVFCEAMNTGGGEVGNPEEHFFFTEAAVLKGMADYNPLKRKWEEWEGKFVLPGEEED